MLHFAEIYWGNIVEGGAGSRKFHVNIEGQRKLTDYDIYAKAGGALRAVTETFRVSVTDGTLNIAFLQSTANEPSLSALEVLSVNTSSRLAFTEKPGSKGTSFDAVLHPNPADDKIFVTLTEPATVVTSTVITNTTGITQIRNAHQITGENTLEIDVSGLKCCFYLLRLNTNSTDRYLKFVKR